MTTTARATPRDDAHNPDAWGPRLYAWLEEHWTSTGTNANAWTHTHPGLQGPTVSRWRSGTAPSLQALRAVADALDVSMVDVLVAAGIVRADEAGREAPRPAVPSIDVALANDPGLSELQRRTLRDMLAAIREVESGAADRVTGGAKAPRARRKPRV